MNNASVNFMLKFKSKYPDLNILSDNPTTNKIITVADNFGNEFKSYGISFLRSKYPSIAISTNKSKYFGFLADKIHKSFYDYSISKYINSSTRVEILCPKHGKFNQVAITHLSGHGCPKCVNYSLTRISPRSFSDFTTKFIKMHPNLKIISEFNGTTKSIVVSDEFGNRFKTQASNMLVKSFPTIRSAINKTEYFIFLANKIHNNLYSYNKLNYLHGKKKLIITCEVHGDFLQTPNNHLNGAGCPHCKTKGYTKSEWVKFCDKNKYAESTLYFIKCFDENESFFKIGITNKSVKERFYNKQLMPYNYSVLKEIKGSPEYIFRLEKRIHSRFLNQKYIPKIKFSGYTECFN